MESTDSTAGGGGSHNHPINLPPGFRFHPTDEELVVHYLKKKVSSSPLPVSIIAEIDLYKYDPWELPAKATFGEHEWYFFSPRDRKYPNGTRPNRAATSGYWKATGTDKPVMTAAGGTQKVGVKKALVFYGGKPPKGVKTNWIMHEYRLVDNKTSSRPVGFDLVHKKNSLRLDDWVLCRIYKKGNTIKGMDHESTDLENSTVMDEMMLVPPSLNVVSTTSCTQGNKFYHQNKPPSTFNTSALVDNEQTLYELGLMSTASHASSMPQLASQSLTGPAAVTNSFSLKRPLPHQRHFYWLNGEQDQATIPNGPSSSNSSKMVPHHVLQGDSTISGMVSLHSEAQQVPSQTTSLLNQFGQVGYDDFRQPYQLAGSLNWYPT